MKRTFALFVGIVLCGSITALFADDALLEQFYGNGVHAFNAGDYVGAHAALTSAIKGGTNDPRAYYFRGLAYLRLGRNEEARADFQKGAELEAGESADVYPVNRSLERIQGSQRQMLEQFRLGVQAAAIQRREAVRRARYEEQVRAEHDVLRKVKPNELPAGPTAAPTPEATTPLENPFAMPSKTVPSTTGAPGPAENPFEQGSAAPPAADPFKAAPAEAPPPAQPEAAPPAQVSPPQQAKPITPEANPFGDQPAVEPAHPAPATTPESPFGDAVPTPAPGTNPVPAPIPPSATNPTPPAAAPDSPFGDAPAVPAPNTAPAPRAVPNTTPPAAQHDDPFGDATPPSGSVPRPAIGGTPPVSGDATAGAAVTPTPGAVSGLFRAITKGGQSPPPTGATPPSPPPIVSMLKGFISGGPSPDGAPPAGMGGPPAPGQTNVPPPADDPFGDSPAMTPPAATPGNAAPSPVQTPPMPAPANNDDPFK